MAKKPARTRKAANPEEEAAPQADVNEEGPETEQAKPVVGAEGTCFGSSAGDRNVSPEVLAPRARMVLAPRARMLRITAPRKGLRRAGRRWEGVTEAPVDEFTDEQLRQLQEDRRLTVESSPPGQGWSSPPGQG